MDFFRVVYDHICCLTSLTELCIDSLNGKDSFINIENISTLTGTGAILIGGTSSRGGQTVFVQLWDQILVGIIRLQARHSVPGHHADYNISSYASGKY